MKMMLMHRMSKNSLRANTRCKNHHHYSIDVRDGKFFNVRMNSYLTRNGDRNHATRATTTLRTGNASGTRMMMMMMMGVESSSNASSSLLLSWQQRQRWELLSSSLTRFPFSTEAAATSTTKTETKFNDKNAVINNRMVDQSNNKNNVNNNKNITIPGLMSHHQYGSLHDSTSSPFSTHKGRQQQQQQQEAIGTPTATAMNKNSQQQQQQQPQPQQEDAKSGTRAMVRHARTTTATLAENVESDDDAQLQPWQAFLNVDVQRVTYKAMLYELSTQQTKTLEDVLPWFLQNMPTSYFRQVPEGFRMQHIKAIAAIRDAQMESMYFNLKNELADGRTVHTFIREGTKPGTLLSMLHELPDKYSTTQPLSRLHVFSTKDDTMSLNMFVYGNKANTQAGKDGCTEQGGNSRVQVEERGRAILEYAQKILDGTLYESPPQHEEHMKEGSRNDIYQRDDLIEYMKRCTDTYIDLGSYNPKRFLLQRALYESVSGTESTAVQITPAEPYSIHQEDHDHHHVMYGGTTATNRNKHSNGDDTATTKYWWVDVAVANSLPQVTLENLCRILMHHNLDVSRARLDVIPDVHNDHGNVTILRTLISPVVQEGEKEEMIEKRMTPEFLDVLKRELIRSKWLDPCTMDLVFRYPWLGITAGEIITCFCSLMHPYLARRKGDDSKNAGIVYSKTNILQTISQEPFIRYASDIANVFLERFQPTSPLSKKEMEQRFADVSKIIEHEVEDTLAKEILHKMMDICQHTMKTNVCMPNRYALGLRLHPHVMHPQQQQQEDVTSTADNIDNENNDASTTNTTTLLDNSPTATTSATTLPYGIIFVHGRRFDGYHVRFRDIARGGLRLVTPPTQEQYALETSRQYEECYGLAMAQQLKNKDIPEGGSKAVNLINTNGIQDPSGKDFVMRKSVKAFADTMLDLIVNTTETNDHIVDYYGRKEVLYLGPDEQVLPEDIEWIVKRAKERRYDTPQAFMSSKPRAGINHKEYGVTSESIHTYLDVALRRTLQIDPNRDAFTVKMTGGPDGDVAGNEMKILIREYGSNVKIIGIADHSGCAEDPNGLDHDELLRLVRHGLPISNFNPSKLSASTTCTNTNTGMDGEDDRVSVDEKKRVGVAVLHTCDTAEGRNARNSMHNRLIADAFLPCGGRPNTIDSTNYKQFLLKDGKTPTSKLIVEGANLFITADARQALYQDANVMIVKDSSANKGGVITSSYEICAAMLCDEDVFYANKQQIVHEVLTKLREMAKSEATLLFREYELYGGSLPEVSQKISNSINLATDALSHALDALSEKEMETLLPLFRAHLPRTLADLSFHQVHERVPDQYIKNAISSCLASKIVYKEGTEFITSLSSSSSSNKKDNGNSKLAKVALKYLEKEKEIATLMEKIEQSNDLGIHEKQSILDLLDAGGARTALSR